MAIFALRWILFRYHGEQLQKKLYEYLARQECEVLLKLLEHSDEIVRVKSLERLEGSNKKWAVWSIEKMLTGYSSSTRRIGMWALDQLVTDEKEKVEICIRALDTSHVDVEKLGSSILARYA